MRFFCVCGEVIKEFVVVSFFVIRIEGLAVVVFRGFGGGV